MPLLLSSARIPRKPPSALLESSGTRHQLGFLAGQHGVRLGAGGADGNSLRNPSIKSVNSEVSSALAPQEVPSFGAPTAGPREGRTRIQADRHPDGSQHILILTARREGTELGVPFVLRPITIGPDVREWGRADPGSDRGLIS